MHRKTLLLISGLALAASPVARADDYAFAQPIELGRFELDAGGSWSFGVGLGGTPLGVVGFSVEFDYAEPVPDQSLASDLRVIMTAPNGTTYSVGGFDTPSDSPWSFQGPGSGGPGHYGGSVDSFFPWKEDYQPNAVWLGLLVNDRRSDPNANLYANVVVTFFIDPCSGDVDNDGVINVNDLVAVILAWGPCPIGAPCAADVNNDGNVDVDDLVEVILDWGTCN